MDKATKAGSTVPIIYIMGPGRGGSTLLERVLNSAPTVFALGEFHTFWRVEHKDLICSCGSPVLRCSFWNEVIETAGLGRAEWTALRRGENAIARTQYLVKKRFLLSRIAGDPAVRAFMELQTVLFEAISRVSGCETLVDSSKSAQRAWILATEPDVSIIHLYRNATDTIVSWRLPKWDKGLNAPMRTMPIQTAAIEWGKIECFGRRLARWHPLIRINYAEFAASPFAVLSSIHDDGIRHLASQIAWYDEHTVMPGQCYHSLNGNPDRYDTGPIVIGRRRVRYEALRSLELPVIRAVGGMLTAFYQ